jgi:hypothetical protein
MSDGTSKGRSRTQSNSKHPAPPPGYEVWFTEYAQYSRLAKEAEARGQNDTYYHDNLPRLREAIKIYGLEDELKNKTGLEI